MSKRITIAAAALQALGTAAFATQEPSIRSLLAESSVGRSVEAPVGVVVALHQSPAFTRSARTSDLAETRFNQALRQTGVQITDSRNGRATPRLDIRATLKTLHSN